MGLRVFPWLHEARRRNHPITHLFDCTKCQMRFDVRTRRAMGCGFERPLEGARAWSPMSLNPMWVGDSSVCPGYTTKLPEVIEVVRARLHWKEGGGLRDFCDETPTDALRLGVEVSEGSVCEMQAWAVTPKSEGGGGQ